MGIVSRLWVAMMVVILCGCSGLEDHRLMEKHEPSVRSLLTQSNDEVAPAGSLASIEASFKRGDTEKAVIESFFMASKNGAVDVDINTIALTDPSSRYLTNEHSYMAFHDALFLGMKARRPSLTPLQWQDMWRKSPQSGDLLSWVDYCESLISLR